MSAFADHATDIMIDTRTGRIDNARLHEKLALRLMRIVVTILSPFHMIGMSYAARMIRTLLPSKKSIQFILSDDSVMRVDYCDAYWMRLILPSHVYEPVLHNFLQANKNTPFAFIDGGANHGYWSVLVSSKAYGSHKSIAIEAASDTFTQLEENKELNSARFMTMNRAIGALSNQSVRVYGAKHEGRTIVATKGAVPILDCLSISLDEIADQEDLQSEDNFVVKLDIEGVEISAMNAAARLIEKNTLFIFEDHGSDPTHAATRNAINNIGLKAFWCGGLRPEEISDLTQVTAIKKSRRCGYEIAATKSKFWLAKLETISLETNGVAQ